jgi:hypothetical protein
MPDRALREALKAIERLGGTKYSGKDTSVLNDLSERVKPIVCRVQYIELRLTCDTDWQGRDRPRRRVGLSKMLQRNCPCCL